jgi:preprotein translocase subunit SecY
MSKFGIGHGRLLIILGGILARIPPGLNAIPGAERFCSAVFHTVAIWAITSLVTAFGYVAGRRLLSR